MKRDDLDLVELSLVEPLLVRRAFLHLEQHSFECRDATVLILQLQASLLFGLLLLDPNVIAFNLLLQML